MPLALEYLDKVARGLSRFKSCSSPIQSGELIAGGLGFSGMVRVSHITSTMEQIEKDDRQLTLHLTRSLERTPSSRAVCPRLAGRLSSVRAPLSFYVRRMTITKEDLSRFILQVAEGSYSRDDWQRIAVNHYSDKKMEEARRKLVRYVCGYEPIGV